MNKKWIIICAVTGVLVISAAAVGPIMSRVETPSYQSLASEKNIEIRRYNPMIIAEVEVEGERKTAIKEGFRLLADYIFGNNVSKQKIAMTAPVQQEPSETIAMTAPVQQQRTKDAWKISFVMPSAYSIKTLPKPNDPAVKLIPVSQRDYLVIRYSGNITDENILKQEQALFEYIESNKIKTMGTPMYAFYNPPWTLPFLRRNEIMIEIKHDSQ